MKVYKLIKITSKVKAMDVILKQQRISVEKVHLILKKYFNDLLELQK